MDIEAFSDTARTNPVRLRLHQHLTRLLTGLLAGIGVTEEQYATSDTGDGLVISVAAEVPAERLVDPLVPRLADRLASFNQENPPPARMRLRAAIHAGRVLADPEPIHGEAVIHTCRLMDSPPVRACLKATERPLAVIASRVIHDDVIKHGYGRIDPAAWHSVLAEAKETRAPAWAHVPGDPVAPLRAKVVTTDGTADGRSGSIPRQLPARLTEFTGRETELAHLRDMLGAVAAGVPAVAITAIDGLGGIGKSTLAIEAAWRLSSQFPDGQIYLDLRGSITGLDPLDPLQAMSHLLRSLGVDPNEAPTHVEEAAAHYRTLASNRRLLLVFDNARNAAQLRPLLPGHPGCAVLITSRDTLAFLEGATRLQLDVLTAPKALELLGRLAGHGRVQAEPEAASRLVELCGFLPLALQITGRRLGTRPAWSLSAYAARLENEQQRLDELSFGDRAVRSSFELSYRLLEDRDPQAARALRLLSILDGPDVAVPVAAALLEISADRARAVLEGLVDTSLLTAPQSDRYQFHDLVRLFAQEHAIHEHPHSEWAAALSRTLGFYTATVWHTLELLRPSDWRLATADSQWREGGVQFLDAPAALTWLEAERANLLAAVFQAAGAESGVPAELASQLTRALIGFFETRSHWDDVLRVNQTVMQLGHRIQDGAIQAYATNDLGIAYRVMGRYEEAIDHLQDIKSGFQEAGDRSGEAEVLLNLGIVYGRLGRFDEAIDCHRASLESFRSLDDRRGEAASMNGLGIVYGRLGRFDEAIDCHRASLESFRSLDDRRGEAASMNNLGAIHRLIGRFPEALDYHHGSLRIRQSLGDRRGEARSLNGLGIVHGRLRQYEESRGFLEVSIRTYQEVGDRYGKAQALRDLGDVLHEVGRASQAQSAWQEALSLSESLNIPEADEIRVRLAGLSP